MRFTWNPALPLPYESAWGLFSKLLALNYCNPVDIAAAIVKKGIPRPRKLDFRDSSWIDFDRFSEMLRVHPKRLKRCFLDQLGFPHITPNDETAGIRFCPLCLAKGYHSVFFDLGMVGGCPIHGVKLAKPCVACTRALLRGGLLHEVILQDDQEPLPDFNFSQHIYGSHCGHIYFDPNRPLRSAFITFSRSEQCEIELWGDRLVRWWGSIYRAPNGIPEVIGPLARVSSDDSHDRDLGNRLGMAEAFGGACPWPLRVNGRDRQLITLTRDVDSPDEENGTANQELLFDAYRAVRRCIYKQYVKPHSACWKKLTNLTRLESQALSAESVCSVTLAYASWRMSIEGFSNVECFNNCRKKPSILPIRVMRKNIVDAKTNAQWWFLHFFAILEDVETHLARGHFFIERGDWPFLDTNLFNNVSWSFMALPGGDSVGQSIESWWLIFPDQHRLLQRARIRCMSRTNGSDVFQLGSKAYNLSNWEWTGNFRESNAPRRLFKIRNSSPLLGNSYSCLNV